VIEAAKEKGLLSIGCMGDQKDQGPDSVMTSVMWNMWPTVEAVLDQVRSGSFAAANLAEFSFMKNEGSARAEINTAVKGGIPEELMSTVQAKAEEMTSGAFTTPVNEKTPAGSVTIKS
jgi:basic membrane lipoprotein Med (substrate-binding protein (PBP1-ABC) superfamily)